MARLDGASVTWSGLVKLNWRATPGSMASRSGYVAAMQEALKRVATAPIETGTAVALARSQV